MRQMRRGVVGGFWWLSSAYRSEYCRRRLLCQRSPLSKGAADTSYQPEWGGGSDNAWFIPLVSFAGVHNRASYPSHTENGDGGG